MIISQKHILTIRPACFMSALRICPFLCDCETSVTAITSSAKCLPSASRLSLPPKKGSYASSPVSGCFCPLNYSRSYERILNEVLCRGVAWL